MKQTTFETIIGTHNSMSYLPPLRWWGWLMLPFARCQRKTIDEQLAAGARCFDLRVSFDRNGMAHFRHGWCLFGGDETVTSVLTRLQRCGEPIYVRLILEEPLSVWNTIKKALGLKATQKPDPVNEYYFLRPLPKDLQGADFHRRLPQIRLGAAPRLRHRRHSPAPVGLIDGRQRPVVATPVAEVVRP